MQLKACLEALGTGAGLRVKFEGQGGAADAIVAIAKEIGFPMAAEALNQAQAIPLEDEIIDVIVSAAKYSPTHKLKGGHEKPGVPCTAAAKKPTTSLVAAPRSSFWLLAA